MGQVKGTPTYTAQQQAYIDKYGTSDPTKRDKGVKPVMIDDQTTLNEYVDVTFDTDAAAAIVTSTFNSTFLTVSRVTGSLNATTSSLVGITNGLMAVTASMKAATIFSGSVQIGANLGNYANDTAAQAGRVPVGGLYHTSGTVKVRLV